MFQVNSSPVSGSSGHAGPWCCGQPFAQKRDACSPAACMTACTEMACMWYWPARWFRWRTENSASHAYLSVPQTENNTKQRSWVKCGIGPSDAEWLLTLTVILTLSLTLAVVPQLLFCTCIPIYLPYLETLNMYCSLTWKSDVNYTSNTTTSETDLESTTLWSRKLWTSVTEIL